MFIKSKSWNGYQPLVGPENPGSTILSSTWNDSNFGNIDISCNRAADRPLAKREHHMRSLILSILLENQLSSRRTTCRQQKMFGSQPMLALCSLAAKHGLTAKRDLGSDLCRKLSRRRSRPCEADLSQRRSMRQSGTTAHSMLFLVRSWEAIYAQICLDVARGHSRPISLNADQAAQEPPVPPNR